MTRTTQRCAVLIAALVATTLVGTITSASAKGTQPKSRDSYVTNPNDPGLIELYSAPEPGQIGPMNWDGAIGGWGPGNFESRHWADNDYTEIQFIGCSLDVGGGKSAGVKLWQAIPFNLDADMGMQTYYNCFTGPDASTRAYWNGYYAGGDNRYFTIPQLNGSIYTRAHLYVKRVYVDTALAD
ncbi:hypothetical protein GCM10010222_72830 [Streptomyces tanashiensis]|uniref:hypothetical protein n=1 Tax=Streptomyces tanashiensis TaxID=67367 RepID=UPI0016723B56|nr:hypothetical protein [Streptomyces tanashiensis]GGT20281.1 hypothetical protein GCM10010222_72830 [Streptomyces tanashiensis]